MRRRGDSVCFVLAEHHGALSRLLDTEVSFNRKTRGSGFTLASKSSEQQTCQLTKARFEKTSVECGLASDKLFAPPITALR